MTIQNHLAIRGKIEGLVARKLPSKSELWINVSSEETHLGVYALDLSTLSDTSKSLSNLLTQHLPTQSFQSIGLSTNQSVVAVSKEGDVFVSATESTTGFQERYSKLGAFSLAQCIGHHQLALASEQSIAIYALSPQTKTGVDSDGNQYLVELSTDEKITAIAGNENVLVAGLDDGTLVVWRILLVDGKPSYQEPVQITTAHHSAVTAINFIQAEGLDYMVSYGEDLKLFQTRLDDLVPMARASKGKGLHTQKVTQILSAKLGRFYTVGEDQSIRSWTDKFSNIQPTSNEGLSLNTATIAQMPFKQNDGTWTDVSVIVVGSNESIQIYSLNEEINPLAKEEDQENQNRGKIGSLNYQIGLAKQWAETKFRRDYAADQRLALIEQVGTWQDDLGLELLSKWIREDFNVSNQMKCLDYMIKNQHPMLWSTLESLLNLNEFTLAKKTFDGLRDLFGAESLRPMKSAFKKGIPALIQYALEALAELANLGDDQAFDLLFEKLKDDREDLSQLAISQIIRVVPGAKGQLYGLKSKFASVHLSSLQALYDRKLLKDQESKEVLFSMLDHSDRRLSKQALLLLLLSSTPLSQYLRTLSLDLHRDFLEIEAASIKTNKGQTEKRAEAQPLWQDQLIEKLSNEDQAILYELCVHHEDWIAIFGALGLAFLGEKQALPRLSSLAHSKELSLRLLTTRSVSALAKKGDEQAKTRLIALCSDSHANVRAVAFDEIKQLLSASPLEIVKIAIKSQSPEIRIQALPILSELAKAQQAKATAESQDIQLLLSVALSYSNDLNLAREAKKLYIQHQLGGDHLKTQMLLLGSVHEEIRRGVFQDLLPQIDEPWAMDLLEKCFNDHSPTLVLNMLNDCLNQFKNKGVQKHNILQVAGKSRHIQVRIIAYQNVDPDWDRSRALSLLREGLKDESPEVSLCAFERLLALLGGAQDELIEQALTHQSDSLRTIAINHLIESTANWKDALLWKAVNDPKEEIRTRVFKALRGYDSVETAVKLLESNYQDIRHKARLTLGKYRDIRVLAVVQSLLAIKRPDLDAFKYAEQQAILEQTLAQIKAQAVIVQPKIEAAQVVYDRAFGIWKKDMLNAIEVAKKSGFVELFDQIFALATDENPKQALDAQIKHASQDALPYLLAFSQAEIAQAQIQKLSPLKQSSDDHLRKQAIWALNLLQDIEALQTIWTGGSESTDRSVLSAFSYAHDFFLKIYANTFHYEFNFKLQVSEIYFQLGICPSVESQQRAVYAALINQKQGLSYLLQAFSLSKQIISEDLSRLSLYASTLRLLTAKRDLPELLIASIHHASKALKLEAGQLLSHATSSNALLNQWLSLRKEIEKQDEAQKAYELAKKDQKDLAPPVFLGPQDYLTLSALLNHENPYAQLKAFEILSALPCDSMSSQRFRNQLIDAVKAYGLSAGVGTSKEIQCVDASLLSLADAQNLAFGIFASLCANDVTASLDEIEKLIPSFKHQSLSVLKSALRASSLQMRRKAMDLLQKHRSALGLSHEALAQLFLEATRGQESHVQAPIYEQACALLAAHDPERLYRLILEQEDQGAEFAFEALLISAKAGQSDQILKAFRHALSSAYRILRSKVAVRWAKLADFAQSEEHVALSIEISALWAKTEKEKEDLKQRQTEYEADVLKKKEAQFKIFNLSQSDCHLLAVLKEKAQLSHLMNALVELLPGVVSANQEQANTSKTAQKQAVELKGSSFLFTGAMVMKREDAEQKVKDLGGEIASSVNKKLKYLVVGEKAGSKLDKAKELGITTLTEAEFVALINGGEVVVKEAVAIPKKDKADGLLPLSPELKLQIAEILSARKDHRALETLRRSILSEDAQMQSRAAQALAMLKHPQSAQILWDRLINDPAQTAQKSSILNAIKALRDPSIVPQIVAVFRDKADWVYELIEVVMEISGHSVPISEYHVWEKMTEDEKRFETERNYHDEALNQLMVALIKSGMHEQVYDHLDAAKTSRSNAVDQAFALLCALPLNRILDHLRQQSFEAYAWRVKHRKSDPQILINAINHRDEECANLACEGLALAGFNQGLDRLLKLAKNSDTYYTWRTRAIKALGEAGDVRAVAILIQLAQDSSQGYEAEALEALGHMNKSEIADDILQLLQRALYDEYQAEYALRGLHGFNTNASRQLMRDIFTKQVLDESTQAELLDLLLENKDEQNQALLTAILKQTAKWPNEIKDSIYEGLVRLYGDSLALETHVDYFLSTVSNQTLYEAAFKVILSKASFAELIDLTLVIAYQQKGKYSTQVQKLAKIEEKLKQSEDLDLVLLLKNLSKFMQYLPSFAETILSIVVAQSASLTADQKNQLMLATIETEQKWVDTYDRIQRGNQSLKVDLKNFEKYWSKLIWFWSSTAGGDRALESAIASEKTPKDIKYVALFAMAKQGVAVAADFSLTADKDMAILEAKLLTPAQRIQAIKQKPNDLHLLSELSKDPSVEMLKLLRSQASQKDPLALNQLFKLNDKEGIWLMAKDTALSDDLRSNALLTLSLFKDERVEAELDQFVATQKSDSILIKTAQKAKNRSAQFRKQATLNNIH